MGAPSTVLVIEDDLDVLEILEEVLSRRGFEVVGATDGHRALELLRVGVRPRFILLDLMMQPMDGFAFRAEQRADPRLADIPIIVMSAGEPAGERISALDAADFLQKPVPLATLLAAVERLS